MKLDKIQLPVTNRLYTDYVTNSENIAPFFHYTVEADAFEKRAQYLQAQTYNYQELARVIEQYMERFGITQAVQHHIADLREGALAIVGGQQAGILTGPLYSVHKAITVILLAKQQSAKLGKKVVPIFWIAGEDHDIEEINHTYTNVDYVLKKRAYSERTAKKYMASNAVYDRNIMKKTFSQIFADFGETEYTASLLEEVLQFVDSNETFTQLFTAMMNDLFGKHGLLMIDAANPKFRQFETVYFERLIENSHQIAQVVVEQEQELEAAGYTKPIFATASNSNLFYVKDGERHLLEWRDGFAQNDAARVKFTKDELLQIAKHTPEQLSNNVVTRPLMQEMTIPVLAFVGGPGELAYWATLKPAFEQLKLQMPIFTPRLHVSFVTRQTQSLLEQLEHSVEQVFTKQLQQSLDAFIESVQDKEAVVTIDMMEQQMKAQYQMLQAQLQASQLNLEEIVATNEAYHTKQFDYLKQKIVQQVLQKHQVKIRQYNTIQLELLPNGGLQERVYNPYMFMNVYGKSLVDDVLKTDIEITTEHQVLYF